MAITKVGFEFKNQQPEQCERAHYPGARAHLSSASLCNSTWLLPSDSQYCPLIVFLLFKLSIMITPLESLPFFLPEVIGLLADAACWKFFMDGESKYFQFALIFWFRFKVVNLGFNLRSKFLGLAWKQVRNDLEISTHFGLRSGITSWLVGWWILWHINLCRLFNAKSIFLQIVSSISNNSV